MSIWKLLIGKKLDTLSTGQTIHLIFGVKYRRKVFTRDSLLLLKEVFSPIYGILGCTLIEFGGESTHLYFLVSLSPKIAICELIRRLKGGSSDEVRKRLGKELRNKLLGSHLWSPSYCV